MELTGAALKNAAAYEPKARRGLAVDLWWMAALSGVVLLALAALRMAAIDWGAVGIMSALGLATGVFAFRVDERTYVSFASAVFAATVVLFGAFVGVWVVALTTAVLEVVSFRRGFRTAMEDIGVEVVAVFAAGILYVMIGGRVAPQRLGLGDVWRFLAMFGTFGLIGAGLRSITSEKAGYAFVHYARWLTGRGAVIELALLPLGLLLVASYTPGEPATFPLLATVLMVSGAAGRTLWDTKQLLVDRVEELKWLNSLGRELSSTLRVDVLVTLLHEHARNRLDASIVCVALHDEAEGTLDYRVSFLNEAAVTSWTAGLDSSLTSWVVRHRAPLLVGAVDAERETRPMNERMMAEAEKRGIEGGTWLGVPLISGERFVGVLSVHGQKEDAFEEGHLDLFANIGGQIARAAENARLYEGLEQSRAAIEEWNKTLEERVDERTAELESARRDLQELNDSLERRVEERTKELRKMQERIIESGRLAAVGEMAAGIAHELNNPLGGIIGYAQYDAEKILAGCKSGLTGEDADRIAGHLAHVEREAQRCRGIVEKLLSFSQESAAAFSRLDVNDVIRDTIALTEKQLAMRGIELETKLGQALPQVVGDPRQLQQVFANIILNARNAMAAGGKLRVTSTADVSPDGPLGVTVEFADDGCGIREEYLGRVFEPFFTTREVGQGTGLGLSVSYGIVRDHGGDIEVESEIGVGSRFLVRLPASDVGGGSIAVEQQLGEQTC
jgi:signal transduction histidine kinase